MSRWKKVWVVANGFIVGFIVIGCLLWVVLPLRQLAAAHPPVPRNLVIAHRGASWLAPEETLAAYQIARDLGADRRDVPFDEHLRGRVLWDHRQ